MQNFPETNYSLIARVKDLGDGTSWMEFVAIYQPVIYQIARRRGLQDSDAHDVMQQVFVSIAGAIDRWTPDEGRPPFRAWLTTITQNAALKALTRRRHDKATGSTSVMELMKEHPNDHENDIIEELRKQARREMIRWAVQKIEPEFSEATWGLFKSTSIEGESVASVAKRTQRSAGAIYVAKHRVISRLKEEVSRMSQQWDL